jgi:putative peptidoglycan lipid II flippase
MTTQTLIGRISRHLVDPHSHHRRIASGFLWVSSFVLIGKLAGAAKEMAIAWRFGVSEMVDAYVFVFQLITWPVSVWFSVLTMVLVPLVARTRNDNPAALPRFRGELLGLAILIGIILGALVFLGFPAMLRAGWTGLSGDALEKALDLAASLSLLAPLGVVISLFSAWTLACGKHRNTLFEGVPALVLLGVLLLPPGWVPEPLLWGTVAGFALHLTALATPLRRHGELQAPRFSFRSQAWAGFWGGISIMAAGQALISFTGIIDQFFAASLGPGSVSMLSYANRILALILGLGALALGRATLPVFSEAHAKGDADLSALAMPWVKWMFVLGLIVLVAGWALSPFVVKLLFERGAFTAEDTNAVASILRYALFRVPFYFAGIVMVSALSSQKRYSAIASIASFNLFSKTLMNFLLAGLLGLAGIVLATAIMQMISMALFFMVLRFSK